jgi:glycosyltransferase involved in cell wall biosynthesis
MKVCLYDHHDYVIPTDGIGGVIGLFQILYNGLKNLEVDLTLIVNDSTSLISENKFKVIKLPFNEIEEIRWGKRKITEYFDGDIFFSNSSGRHVNFDFSGFKGNWVLMCHGCYEFVGNSKCQIFVSNNQLEQHLRDNLFDSYCNDYRVVHNSIDPNDYFWEEGNHDKIVWMGRIDGAKAERLYDIALNSNQKIYDAGFYTEQFEWLFDKIISTNNVVWLGKIEGVENKRKFYSEAKVSIHCSTFEDPCPTTVLEAQACGIPVISYSNGCKEEIMNNKQLIFDNLENLIDELNNPNYIYGSDKETTRNFILKKFTSDIFVKKMLEIFENYKLK